MPSWAIVGAPQLQIPPARQARGACHGRGETIGETRRGGPGALNLLAHPRHSGHQIQQRAAKVTLGHQHLPVAIQADVVHGGAGNRPLWWRGGQRTAGQILPSGPIAAPGGVHHAAQHGAVLFDPGRNDPHLPIVPPAGAADDGQTPGKSPEKTGGAILSNRSQRPAAG